MNNRMIGYPSHGQKHGEKRRHEHAAANSEKPCGKPRAAAEQKEQTDEGEGHLFAD